MGAPQPLPGIKARQAPEPHFRDGPVLRAVCVPLRKRRDTMDRGEGWRGVIYRYVLHLEDTEARRTIRWTFTHPIAESHVVDLPTFGRWYVTRVLTEDANGAGVAYCTPAE